MSEKQRITRAFGIVGLSTLASRILGFIREVVIAHYFGAGMATDAFFVAFQLPNTFRRLLAEGSLTVSFIPVFSQTMLTKGREAAFRLANNAFAALSLILITLVVVGVIFAPWLVTVMVPGFEKDPGKIELTAFLARLMFPYLFFVSLMALCMGILNSLRHFFAPAMAPIFLSIAEVVCVVVFYHYFDPPILALVLGVIVGGFLQLSFQIPFLRKQGVSLQWAPDFRNPALRQIGRLMLPAIFGSAIYQIGLLINNFLASFLSSASVSYLTYAGRIMEFPLGIFIFSIGTAILPSLSRLAAIDDRDKLKETFVFAFRSAMFIIVPAMIGIIVLCIPITHIIFEHGSFTAEATKQTAYALFFYAIGLCAVAGVRVTVPVFYALHDTKTPVRIGAFSVVCNICFSLILMHPLRHGGLALALSIASAVNLSLLLIFLRRKIGPLGLGGAVLPLVKVAVAALGMGVFCWVLGSQVEWTAQEQFSEKLLYLCGTIGGGALMYAALAFLFRCPELTYFKDVFHHKAVTSDKR